jgi:hypothetical protein
MLDETKTSPSASASAAFALAASSLFCVLFAMTGCAAIQKSSTTTDRVVRSDTHDETRAADASATFELHGAEFALAASVGCRSVGTRIVEKTTETVVTNADVGTDLAMLVSGVAVLGTTAAVANGIHLSTQSATQQEYDRVAVWTAGLGFSVPLMLIPLIDAMRAVDSSSSVTVELFVNEPCSIANNPFGFGKVELGTQGTANTYSLGQTNAAGQLTVDLDSVLPAEWPTWSEASVSAMPVTIDRYALGTLDLRALRFAKLENKLWRDATSNPTCVETDWELDCFNVRRYLDRYPRGSHSAEARAILSAWDEKLMAKRLEEDNARARELVQLRIAAEEVAERKTRLNRAQEEGNRRVGACRARCRSTCQGDNTCVNNCSQNCK